MKWPKRQAQRRAFADALDAFSSTVMPLPGMAGPAERHALSMQIVASLRRDEYFLLIQQRGPIPRSRADPADSAFEPEVGVVHFLQQGEIDEAAWLVFLMVYLAKPEQGWRRLRDIYGGLGIGRWDWATVSQNPAAFEQWLAGNWTKIGGKFGNHRKYESLDPTTMRPMGPAAIHYINWIKSGGGHVRHFATIIRNAGNDPHVIFDAFYRALPIKGFGRLGRFDWAAMLARYGIIPAEAGTAYLEGATGPGRGARLLFHGNPSAKVSNDQVQGWLDLLDAQLGVGMGGAGGRDLQLAKVTCPICSFQRLAIALSISSQVQRRRRKLMRSRGIRPQC